MKDAVLIELAEKWEREARNHTQQPGTDETDRVAYERGERASLSLCAAQLRTLVDLLGDGE